MITQEMVNQSIQNALDNGYDDLMKCGAEVIANDMSDFDSSYEGLGPEIIVPFVQTWLNARDNIA